MDRMQKRGLTSFLTLGGFLVMVFTGIVLYIAPLGWAANRLDWTFLGLNKHQWSDIHVIFSMLWMVAGLFHLYFNWRVLKAFIHNKAHGGWRMRKELALAAVVMAVVMVCAVYQAPPVQYIVDLSDRIKSSWITTTPTGEFADRSESESHPGIGRAGGGWRQPGPWPEVPTE